MLRPALPNVNGAGRRKRIRVVEMIGIALAARQQHRLARHHVGPVRRAGVGEIRAEVHRIQRRSVLERERAAELPVAQHRLPHRRRGDRIHVASAQSAPDIEERQAALQPQVPLVLRAEAFEQAGNLRVGIVNRLGPHETRQERQPLRESLLRLDLQRMIDGVGDVLDLKSGPSSGNVRSDCRSPGRGARFSPVSTCAGVLKRRNSARSVPFVPT